MDAQTLADYLRSVLARSEGVSSVRQWEKHVPPMLAVEWVDGDLLYVEVTGP